jgi:predicted component of type VI protein secretion system
MPDAQLIKLRLSLMGRPVRNYTFDKSVIQVGRDPAADVYVDNPGVSRDHFRLERTDEGEYRVVDLGSANGTFVNDQMVNAALVHNNDVVRFGKYTLWVGYELDRRTSPRGGGPTSPEPMEAGHTVVLSRNELGKILEHEKERAAEPAKVTPMTMPAADPATTARRAPQKSQWAPMFLGFALGCAFGSAAVWLLLRH